MNVLIMNHNMQTVKVEYERRETLCRGCLSTDRRLSELSSQVDLFHSLLGVQHQFCEGNIILCWECMAILKKIQSFQNRIQHAQFVLQQSLYELDNLPVACMSTLSITKRDYYDENLIHEPIKPKEPDPKELLIDIIKQEQAEDEDSVNFTTNDDSFSDYDVSDVRETEHTISELDGNTPEEERDGRNEVKVKKQSIRRYECKAHIEKLNVDLSDTKKHCATVVLTEKEIEDVLERDKVGYGYKKLLYKCGECKNAYKRLVDLRRHETFQHRKPLPSKCLVCNAALKTWESLQQHWRRHNQYFKCSICGWLSHSLAAVTKHHRRSHTSVYTCKTCEAKCSTLREFSNHYKEAHERIICDHCGKTFIKKKTLEVHIKRHHTPATCQECHRTYAHYHVLENHYRMQHPQLTRADTRTELAYCVECDKQFPSVYKYRRHLATAATHTPPKPARVPCPECGKVFARKIRMTNHYKSVHVNTTKHRCDICNKTFCSAFSARTHRQHVHEKIPMPKNKMCDICGRGFSTNRILANHRRTHTGERPYKCSYCPATFAQRTAMKTHEKTQHKHTT